MPSLSGPVSYKGAVPLQRAGHSLCLADWEAHKVALDQSHGLLAWVGHAELTLHPARLKRMTSRPARAGRSACPEPEACTGTWYLQCIGGTLTSRMKACSIWLYSHGNSATTVGSQRWDGQAVQPCWLVPTPDGSQSQKVQDLL